MAQQNIYDDEIFFEGYKKIRDNKINANNLFEIPTLFSMLPDLKNKRILDFWLLIIVRKWWNWQKSAKNGMLITLSFV